jgi:hypothetical protein
VVAYPLLLSLPIVALVGGIRLGKSDALSHVALLSQRGTPVENWTLFLISIGIVGFLYLGHCYETGTYRVRLGAVAVATGSSAALLLFGAWGLYGATVAAGILYAIARNSQRLRDLP